MTSLPAVDGTIFALAAQGAFDSVGGAVLAGLTVIAGASAWMAARREFADDAGAPALALVAAASTLAAVAAAVAGATVGARVELTVFPAAAGVSLMVIAAEVAGLRVPRLARVPLPAACVAIGALAEVAAWIR